MQNLTVFLVRFKTICEGKLEKRLSLNSIVSWPSPLWLGMQDVNIKDLSRIQTSEMRFMRYVKGCTRQDQIHNGVIRIELQITVLKFRVEEHRNNWTSHLGRMLDDLLPKQLPSTNPKGKISLRKAIEMWTDFTDRNRYINLTLDRKRRGTKKEETQGEGEGELEEEGGEEEYWEEEGVFDSGDI